MEKMPDQQFTDIMQALEVLKTRFVDQDAKIEARFADQDVKFDARFQHLEDRLAEARWRQKPASMLVEEGHQPSVTARTRRVVVPPENPRPLPASRRVVVPPENPRP